MPKSLATKDNKFTDLELVQQIQYNQDYLGEVYKRCKKNSLFYMRKRTSNSMNEEILEDIFQNAIIVLYEKIKSGDFVLTVKIQTYIDRVCYNQLLNQYKANQKTIPFPDNSHSSIIDVFEPIVDEKEPKAKALESALEKIKAAGGHCYELLTLFWYHNKSMKDLTATFGYTNEVNTRNQKARCQERLRKMVFNELNP